VDRDLTLRDLTINNSVKGCPVCYHGLRVRITTSRNGRHAVMLFCDGDARHFRAFINDRRVVEDALSLVAHRTMADIASL